MGNRVLVWLCVGMGVLVLVTGAAIVYGAVELGHIPRIACGSCADIDEGAPMNVLVVGSDTRRAVPGEAEFGTPQTVQGQRSDTMFVLRIDQSRKRAALLSIPRDLYVPIASGGMDRINTAFEKGPDNLVRTVSADLGIPIHHYVEVDFAGFRDIVRAVGGVGVYFPTPARDLVSGLRVPRAGCATLDGPGALAYVRSRHYETFERGRWRAGGVGDLDRITRQQEFMRRVLSKVRGVRNPVTLHHLITTGTHNVRFDRGLSAREIEALAQRFRSLSPDALDMATVPAVFDHTIIAGQRASILRVLQPDAKQAIDHFLGRGGTQVTTTVAPSSSAPPSAPPSAPGLVTTTTAPQRLC